MQEPLESHQWERQPNVEAKVPTLQVRRCTWCGRWETRVQADDYSNPDIGWTMLMEDDRYPTI